jgi:hypothetical protein
MTTLVIDSTTHIADLLAVMGARRLRVDVDEASRRGVIAPVVSPDDYDNKHRLFMRYSGHGGVYYRIHERAGVGI